MTATIEYYTTLCTSRSCTKEANMNEQKEFYTKFLSNEEQLFLKSVSPLSLDTPHARHCFNNCIRSTLEALENNNKKIQYSGVIGLIFFYE